MNIRDLIVLSLLLSFHFFSASGQEQRKFELWNQSSVAGKISGKSSIVVTEKIHYSTAINELTVKMGELSYRKSVNPNFSWNGGFRITSVKKNGLWINEQRPLAAITLLSGRDKFRVSFTGRMEYLMYKEQKDFFRTLAKMELETMPVRFLDISLFSTGELFTRLNKDNLHIARLYGGVNLFTKAKHIRMKTYYALQYLKNEEANWLPTDVLGLNLNFFI